LTRKLGADLVGRLIGFAVLVVLAVAAALFLVSERSAITRSGYRIARLECERNRTIERNRQLEAKVARLKAPARLVDRIKALDLELVPPEEAVEDLARKAAEPR